MTYTTHEWQKRVKAEFEMPVRELVESFARDGYSLGLTAGALGISHGTLVNYCKRMGIIFPDRYHQRDECIGRAFGNKNWRKRKAA